MQKRIILLVVVSSLVVLLSVGVISYLSVRNIINHSLQTHLTLASLIGGDIEYMLEQNITRLYDISISGAVDLGDGDWEAEKKALKTAYHYSIFSDGVFLLDTDGNVVLTYPHKEMGRLNLMGIPYVNQALTEGRTVVSDVYTVMPTQRKVIFILAPLKDKNGDVVGAAGGEINPANYVFAQALKAVPAADDASLEIVDSHGLIISSSKPERTLTYSDHNKFLRNLIVQKKKAVLTCHRCHSEETEESPTKADMLAFSPLSVAPWGVAIREPQDKVFAPATNLIKVFGVIGIIYLATTLLLALGLSRSIVRPITHLINATKKIADGDLSEPVGVVRDDEVGMLGRSFDMMRATLAVSLDRIRQYNVELEKRVHQRTEELLKRRKQLGTLLNGMMRTQEEERKRIARELHDETSQTIAALGMALDVASAALREGQLTPEMLVEQRMKVAGMLEGINRVIQDLRPSVLDDLGLESSMRWLLERHIAAKGMTYSLEYCDALHDPGNMLDKRTELALFRVVQEAVTNIAKYSEASRVAVSLMCEDSGIRVDITDDGVGFNVEDYMEVGDDGVAGLGLLGMRERVEQLDGKLEIDSKPGGGTRVTIRSPIRRPKEV